MLSQVLFSKIGKHDAEMTSAGTLFHKLPYLNDNKYKNKAKYIQPIMVTKYDTGRLLQWEFMGRCPSEANRLPIIIGKLLCQIAKRLIFSVWRLCARPSETLGTSVPHTPFRLQWLSF